MNARIPVLLFTAFLFVGQFNPPSHAAIIRNVTITNVYSEFVSGTDQRRATNMLNGSGLFGDYHTVQAAGSMWLTLATIPGDITNAFVTFDLGAVHTLDQMKVWNYNETGANTGRGIQRADIFTSTDGVTFTTNFPNVLVNRAPGAFTNFAQTISLGSISARYIGFRVLTNWGDARVGLCKVLFFDTNVAPVITVATRNFSNDRVTVLFSDHVSAASATNPTNYSILLSGTNAATISSAAFDFYPNRIVLQTSVLNSNFVYSVRATNITDTVNGVKVDNTPVPIEAELALWLKADAGVTTNATDEFVNQWNDQSGNGNHAVQAAPVNQPLLVANAMNGKPVLRFDGSGANRNNLDIAHSSSLLIRSDFSLFAVINVQSVAGYNAILTKTLVNQPAPLDWYTLNAGSGSPRLFRGNGNANNAVVGVSNVVVGQSYILSGVARGTNMTEYMNGAFNGSVLAQAGITDRGGPMMVGTRADFVTKMVGDIAEIIFIRGAVSDTERAAINNYLGAKYAIPVINLAITQQPVSTARLEGQTATFSVGVVSSSPAINYQWQRYGTNLPSATNASYTTPILTQAENNSTYRVQVSSPGSPGQFSDTAVLTVLADTEQPTVVSAGRKIWSPSEVVVVFSEPVGVATATVAGNYSLDNGASVNGAVVGDNTSQIVLSTTGMTNGGSYMLTVQNVRDSFNNTIVTTQVPLTVYPAAALWLSASAGVTADVDGYVSQWNDQSGNGNHATAFFDAPARPTLVTNGINGQRVLRFAGAGEPMFSASSPSLAIVGDMSLYAVLQYVDYSTYNAMFGKTTGNLPASYDYYLAINSGTPVFYRGNGGGSIAPVNGATAPSVGVPHIVGVVMGGTTVNHFLDGITNGTGNIAPILADNGDPLGIGTRNDGVTRMKGDVAEMLIFGSALSAADRVALDGYFGAKYGILAGPLPRITIVGNAGGSVMLSWPTPAQPFNLESAAAIVGATWATVTNTIASSGGTNSVTINASGDQQYFRLHKQ